MLDKLQQILKVAEELLAAGDLEGILLAYDDDSEGFTLWDLQSTEKMQQFWHNFNRMPLCMVTSETIIQLKDEELLKVTAQNWHHYISNFCFPPCSISVTHLSGPIEVKKTT